MSMLNHLVDDNTYVPTVWEHMEEAPLHIARATSSQIIDAKYETTMLIEGTVDDIESEVQHEDAAHAFYAVANPEASDEDKKMHLESLRTPESVRRFVAMLTQYEWDFVSKAQEIRSFCVGKLLEEADNPNARIRLKAVELLGKITEVALFTERVEMRKIDLTDAQLEEELRRKLSGLLTHRAEDIPHVEK